MSLFDDIRRVAAMLRPEGRRYSMGIGALLGVNVSDVAAPLFLALAVELTEANLTGGTANTPPALRLIGLDASTFTIVSAVVVYLGLQLFANICRYPMLMWTAVPSQRIAQTVRRRITDHLLGQSQSFFDRAKSGDLMSIATADVKAVRMLLGPAILVGTDTLMLVTFVLLVLFALSWKLALVALVPLPLIYLVTNKLSHLEYEGFEAVQEDLSVMTERVRESYSGMRIIQGYAREGFDRSRFESFSLRHYAKNLWLARVRAAFEPTLDFMLGISTILVLVFGGMWVASGEITIGTFVAFLFLVRYLSGPMIGFGWSISLFQRGRASLGRIRRLVESPVEVEDAPDARPVELKGGIEIRGLSFAYARPRVVDDEDAPQPQDEGPVEALHDIDVRVEAGETLGIFGPVGAGKSTLARLLTRLYDPPRGTVFIDGVDVRDMKLADLRRQVVLAPQETFLFSSTVERNVGLGHEHDIISREQVVEFARLAHLHAEVDSFADGYDTMLGERGVNLSGGQRQRLAIARAIAAGPKILILDDCLSAVDAQTEDAILKNLRTVFAGRTGIVISHRIRAVRDCDHVLVIEEGRATEYGTHEELMAKDGYYSRIAAEQLASTDSSGSHAEVAS
jgi:ATP-binding cassette subfamily B protein